MDIQQALQKYLRDDATCDDMFGPRIFEGSVPTKAGFPFVQYGVTSLMPDLCLEGEIGTATARITYTVGAETETDAINGLLAIRSRLNGVNFVEIEGVDVQHILIQDPGLYEIEQPPDTGEEIAPSAWAAEFEVYYNFAANDPEQGESSSGGGGGSGGGAVPDWPAMVASAEMVDEYGDNGPYDVGTAAVLTFATPQAYWFADSWITWYTWGGDGTVTDALTGLPNGRTIFQGTIDRILSVNSSASVGFYTTLLRVRTQASFEAVTVWPLTAATLTDDYDPTWLDPSYNTPGDAWPEEQGIAYQIAACRTVHGREWARNVAAMKAIHPELTRVFSDNFAMSQVSVAIDDTALLQLAAAANTSQREEFGVALPLICNVTTRWQTDLTAYLDLAADSEIAGWHNEGLCHEHFMTVAEFDNILANQQYWLAKTWPGGGRRYFASNARGDDVSGLCRRVSISGVGIVGNTLEVTCSTDHNLADTSIWIAVPTGVHASLNGVAYAVTRTSDTNFTIDFSPSAPPASGYSNGTFYFPYSGHEVDAGWLHSIRQDGDNVRATFTHGSGDGRFAGYSTPLWRTWQSTYGYATGAPEVVSTHTVDLADYGGSGTVSCVKEIRTPFAGGWYLHVDFSIAERRAWWVNGS